MLRTLRQSMHALLPWTGHPGCLGARRVKRVTGRLPGTARLTAGLCLLLLAGCHVPVGGASDRSAAAPATSQNRGMSAEMPAPAPSTQGDGPVSRLIVNGDVIEAHSLWHGLHEELARQQGALTIEGYRNFVARRAADLLREAISETLLLQKARLNLSPEMEKRVEGFVDEELRKIITTQYEGRQRRYETALQQNGQSLDDIRERLRREIIIRNYLEQEVKPRIAEPTRDELYDAYQQLAESSQRPARRKMSLIDVRVRDRLPNAAADPTPKQRQDARAQAKEKIESAKARLDAGAEFADVARQLSDGLHADDGGSWGWVSEGSVRARFEPAVEALYRLHADETGNIIEVDDGFLIVRCDEIDAATQPDFESIQPKLVQRHFRGTYQRAISQLVEELRDRARIEPQDLGRFHLAVVAAAPNLHAGPRP